MRRSVRSLAMAVLVPSRIVALRKEVARLKAERDILKKATAFFARDAT